MRILRGIPPVSPTIHAYAGSLTGANFSQRNRCEGSSRDEFRRTLDTDAGSSYHYIDLYGGLLNGSGGRLW